MRDGGKFSNGDSMTSHDVKFSIDRMQKINFSAGPRVADIHVEVVDAADDADVVVPPQGPDATFPAKAGHSAAAGELSAVTHRCTWYVRPEVSV